MANDRPLASQSGLVSLPRSILDAFEHAQVFNTAFFERKALGERFGAQAVEIQGTRTENSGVAATLSDFTALPGVAEADRPALDLAYLVIETRPDAEGALGSTANLVLRAPGNSLGLPVLQDLTGHRLAQDFLAVPPHGKIVQPATKPHGNETWGFTEKREAGLSVSFELLADGTLGTMHVFAQAAAGAGHG